MEQGVVQLAVVGYGAHHGLAVRAFEIYHPDVFGMRVDHVSEGMEATAAAAALFLVEVLRDEYAIVGREGIVPDALDHLDGIEVVQRVSGGNRVGGVVLGRGMGAW